MANASGPREGSGLGPGAAAGDGLARVEVSKSPLCVFSRLSPSFFVQKGICLGRYKTSEFEILETKDDKDHY